MPRFIGEIALPYNPPAFGQIRLAVRRHLRATGLIPARGAARKKDIHSLKVACGLSGGADSLALVCALVAEGAKVESLTVDHGLQESSAEVAARAADTARRAGATPRVLTVTVDGAPGATREAEARAARYRALGKAADGRPLFIAHTQNDQAETFLLAALRGTATGMRPVSPNAYVPGGQVHRPLLHIPRETTAEACHELDLEPWADPQNFDLAFLRVAVRTQVLPALVDATNTAPIAALAIAARRAADNAQAVACWARAIDARAVCDLAGVPRAVRREALAGLIRACGGHVTVASVDAAEKLICAWHGQGAVAVGGGVAIKRRGTRLETVPEAGRSARS